MENQSFNRFAQGEDGAGEVDCRGDSPFPARTLSTCIPFAHRGRAAYSLPGDILEIRQNLPAVTPSGERRRLATGLYVLLGQSGNSLVVARAEEDEDEVITAGGPSFQVAVHFLETDAVRATRLRAEY